MKQKFYTFFSLLFIFSISNSSLFAQPANDNCADAVVVMMDVLVDFTNIDATNDGPFHMDSPCPSSGSDSIFYDIWFVHTATFTGELRWSLCGMTDFDSRIAIYNAGAVCPLTDADLMDCNEDGPAACTNFESELDFDAVAGETYMLRIGSFGESAQLAVQGSGTFSITEAPQPIPGDDCDQALPVSLGAGQAVSTEGATTDGPPHPNDNVCFGFNDDNCQSDIWFDFTSPITGTILWSTCNTVNWDPRIVVYGPNLACPVTQDDMIACSDATAGCAGYTNILYFDAVEGESYKLRMGGFGGAVGSGTFDLIEVVPPEPPVNDNCENPDSSWVMTSIEADNLVYLFQGTVINANISDMLVDPSCGDGQGGKFPDVWFEFNNLGLEEIELRYSGLQEGTGFLFEIFENCDGDTIPGDAEICFQYTPDDLNLLTDTIKGLSSTPTNYKIRIAGWLFWTPGDFYFQLVSDNIPVSTKEAPFPGSVGIHPNPVSEELQVSIYLSEQVSTTKVQILNTLGQVVMVKDIGALPSGLQKSQIDTEALPPGVYTLVVSANQAQEAMKFVKN